MSYKILINKLILMYVIDISNNFRLMPLCDKEFSDGSCVCVCLHELRSYFYFFLITNHDHI